MTQDAEESHFEIEYSFTFWEVVRIGYLFPGKIIREALLGFSIVGMAALAAGFILAGDPFAAGASITVLAAGLVALVPVMWPFVTAIQFSSAYSANERQVRAILTPEELILLASNGGRVQSPWQSYSAYCIKSRYFLLFRKRRHVRTVPLKALSHDRIAAIREIMKTAGLREKA